MPNILQVLPLVKKAVNKLRRWLVNSIEEFPQIEADDWWSYARLITIMLVERQCNCGRANCAREHSLTQWDPAERTLESFIYRAVIGPAGLRPNSIAQGMLYPLLREDHGLLVVKVGFKQCAHDAKLYEGARCLACNRPFDPATALVKALDWLVIQGVYVEDVHWWACGKGRKAHYHAQNHCRQILVSNPDKYPEPSYLLQHGDAQHDCCPLASCPRRGQEHGQRGTTLWQRKAFAKGESAFLPSRPAFVLSVIEGVREAVASLQGWRRAWVLFLAREDPKASSVEENWRDIVRQGAQFSHREPLTLAENLFAGREDNNLSRATARRYLVAHAREITKALGFLVDLRLPHTAQEIARFETQELRLQVRENILKALQQRGLDEAGLWQ